MLCKEMWGYNNKEGIWRPKIATHVLLNILLLRLKHFPKVTYCFERVFKGIYKTSGDRN